MFVIPVSLLPANNGTIDLYGKKEILLAASTNSNLTWISPSTSGVFIGTKIHICNSGSGTITVRNPANTITIAQVVSGIIRTFQLDGTSTWNAENPYEHSTVTQLTNLNTAVEINSRSGAISLADDTIAAGQYKKFTVTNSRATASSIVVANMTYSEGSGQPILDITREDDAGSGKFNVIIRNIHASAAVATSTTSSIIFKVIEV